jgi:hypothetical protein
VLAVSQYSCNLNLRRIEFLMDKSLDSVLSGLGSEAEMEYSLEEIAFKAFGWFLNRERKSLREGGRIGKGLGTGFVELKVDTVAKFSW